MQTPIKGLRSFCLAAKSLSFKDAAKELHVSPSAVSHQVRQLEEQLNKPLFLRHARSIELTQEGISFYQSIYPLLTQLDNTFKAFSGETAVSTIRISVPEFFASELLMPLLSQWSALYPKINLQLDTVKSHALSTKETDLSIVLSRTAPSNGKATALFPLSYIPACSGSLYKPLKLLGEAALYEVPLISHQSRPWSWHQWASENSISDFLPKRIIQVDSMFSVARAAQRGLGLALIPLPISQSWFDEKMIVPLFNKELHTNDRFFLVQHDERVLRKELSIFVDWLLRALNVSDLSR